MNRPDQTLHLDPSFVSTPNARNEAMLSEAAAFAVALKRCEKDIRGAKAAAEALLGTAGAVLSSPLPRVFEDLGGGRAAPAPPGPGGAGTIGGSDFCAEDLDAVSKDSSKKLEAEVLAPMARWAAAFAAVSARMKRLEGVRLEVDSRRRTVVALGCRIDRQRLRLPQTRSKGEWAMEQSIKAMQHKEHKLAAARGAFREQEALVFAQLAQLIRDAVWLKSYLAAVMRLQQESYGTAAGSLGPAKAALGASVAMSAAAAGDGARRRRRQLPRTRGCRRRPGGEYDNIAAVRGESASGAAQQQQYSPELARARRGRRPRSGGTPRRRCPRRGGALAAAGRQGERRFVGGVFRRGWQGPRRDRRCRRCRGTPAPRVSRLVATTGTASMPGPCGEGEMELKRGRERELRGERETRDGFSSFLVFFLLERERERPFFFFSSLLFQFQQTKHRQEKQREKSHLHNKFHKTTTNDSTGGERESEQKSCKKMLRTNKKKSKNQK